ncbi:MAG: aminoglycoside phosphotransferase family protein [Chloroflexi bacterium]|nr:aminoglycoside phosphotransferase family protein [Chloroflexota bacterium]
MKIELKAILEAEYGFEVKQISDAPRQFVADTYFIDSEAGERYFCKVVEKPLFVESIMAGTAALSNLQALGFERACFPIQTSSGDLFVWLNPKLIIVYTYIQAEPSYDYDFFTLGALIGEMHALSPRIRADIPRERFQFEHRSLFERQFEAALAGGDQSELHLKFRVLMQGREPKISGYYNKLNSLIQQIKPEDHELVFTHGDIAGNVLVKSAKDLTIVDWDENRLAPKERDLWTLERKEGFLEGYRNVFPEAEVNESARQYGVLIYYFYALLHYFREIFDGEPGAHRERMLTDLEGYFDGWIKPYMERLG